MTPPHPAVAALQRIALVDDNGLDNRFHGIVLKKAGFRGELVVFETGEDAITYMASAAAKPIDLMLLDINLPGANGFEVAEKIGDLAARRPAVVVVMLTSSPDPEDVNRARRIPIVRDYLTKPLTVDGVGLLVAKHLPAS